ncbi:MAG: DUF378 domain-containing protein [Gammaproteobacteria bacterium]|nr:DUF378 domain-containing protein [Gammaproteobacteria bacterium]
MKAIQWISWLIIVLGGLNWGAVGILNMDLVQKVATMANLPILAKIVYIVVGVAALISLVTAKNMSFKSVG